MAAEITKMLGECEAQLHLRHLYNHFKLLVLSSLIVIQDCKHDLWLYD